MTTKLHDINMEDVVRDIAGIDDDWLRNVPLRDLLRVIREIRAQARTVLDRAAITKAEGTS